MTTKRRLFTILYRGERKGTQPLDFDDNATVAQFLTYKFNLDDQISAVLTPNSLVGSSSPSDFDVFDWELQPIVQAAAVRTVRKPGILIVVEKTRSTLDPGKTNGLGTWFEAFVLKSEAEKEPAVSDELRKYLQSDEAKYQPSEYDVFLSYSTLDLPVATNIQNGLMAYGLRMFMAALDILAGDLWDIKILNAISGARYTVILLTTNSASSDWVKYEAGAIWALQKRGVAALLGVTPAAIPEPLRKFQAKVLTTGMPVTSLCRELAASCGKTIPP